MFSKLGKMYRESLPSHRIKFYQLKRSMAAVNLDAITGTENVNNIYLYNALTHLAQIPELNINIMRYDGLCVSSSCLDESILTFAKNKLDELDNVISTCIFMGDKYGKESINRFDTKKNFSVES